VTWIEYGVVETSPERAEAWVFPNREEARAVFERNVGLFAKSLGQAYFDAIAA